MNSQRRLLKTVANLTNELNQRISDLKEASTFILLIFEGWIIALRLK